MAPNVLRIKLGSQGFEVSKQGLGCMGMSAFYGTPKPEPEMIELIHHAINSGVTFLDTSDFYGPHANEILLGKGKIATKFGIINKDGGHTGQKDIRGGPAYVRAACESSLKRLDVDCIDLYYVHRIDTRVPIEVTMGELKKLVEEGKICWPLLQQSEGLMLSIQSLLFNMNGHCGQEILAELGIGIVPYSPLGRGFLSTGPKLIQKPSEVDLRKNFFPRLQNENLETNKLIFEQISEMATRKGCTPSQLALAWVHHHGDDVCPIPGTTKIVNFNQNIGGLSVKLTPEEMTQLSTLANLVKGDRYPSMANTCIDADTPPLSTWKAET